MPVIAPTRRLKRELLSTHRLVAGMDEVGRGALAGPVSVGAVVVDETTGRLPRGLRDSKLLTAAAREELCEPVRRWSVGHAVGHADAAEIDAIGIIAALRLAGNRALATLASAGLEPDVLILDGIHDWLTAPDDLFATGGLDGMAELDDGDGDRGADAVSAAGLPLAADRMPTAHPLLVRPPLVRTEVKGDMRCAVVAAASVLAKCARDAMMVDLDAEHPAYGWAANKGYGAAGHVDALRRLGPSPLHRRSWRLPAREEDVVGAALAGRGMMGT